MTTLHLPLRFTSSIVVAVRSPPPADEGRCRWLSAFWIVYEGSHGGSVTTAALSTNRSSSAIPSASGVATSVLVPFGSTAARSPSVTGVHAEAVRGGSAGSDQWRGRGAASGVAMALALSPAHLPPVIS